MHKPQPAEDDLNSCRNRESHPPKIGLLSTANLGDWSLDWLTVSVSPRSRECVQIVKECTTALVSPSPCSSSKHIPPPPMLIFYLPPKTRIPAHFLPKSALGSYACFLVYEEVVALCTCASWGHTGVSLCRLCRHNGPVMYILAPECPAPAEMLLLDWP